MQPGPANRTSVDVIAATEDHVEGIARIYDSYVDDSPATFDLEPKGADPWRDALEESDPDRGHHLLVAVEPGGAVVGFAKSGTFRERAAYASTCEVSVYVDADQRGRGIGTALYAALLELLDASSLRLATAGVTEPNEASAALHRSFGFERVGTFDDVGVKFGRPWSVTWYQRRLGG